MKNKKWLLLSIIAFPSVFWLILESSTIHSHKLNYFGPKSLIEKGDTVFYQIDAAFKRLNDSGSVYSISSDQFPVFAIQFIKEEYKIEEYRFMGFNEYFSYKFDKIKEIPVFIVGTAQNGIPESQVTLEKFKNYENVNFLVLDSTEFTKKNKEFFLEKPYYVDQGYIVLVDGNKHIRGYYDGRYAAEVKRLIDEYVHLRLKEEKSKIIETNEIKHNQ